MLVVGVMFTRQSNDLATAQQTFFSEVCNLLPPASSAPSASRVGRGDRTTLVPRKAHLVVVVVSVWRRSRDHQGWHPAAPARPRPRRTSCRTATCAASWSRPTRATPSSWPPKVRGVFLGAIPQAKQSSQRQQRAGSTTRQAGCMPTRCARSVCKPGSTEIAAAWN